MRDLDDATLAAAITLAEDFEREITGKSAGPVRYLLAKARRSALNATAALTEADPHDAKGIMALQNDIQRFRETVRWITEAFAAGDEAWSQLDEEEQAAIEALFDQEHDA
jgi:hypothetical protein